ncbi:MAG: orotidine-5'-phosphate decarboxylase [Candidatus Binataceae bacterium]
MIVALDVPSIEEAWGIVQKLDGAASFFKLGPWLSLVPGFDKLLDGLIEKGNRVFLDTKGQDIPETMRAGVRVAARRQISFLTIHGNEEVTDDALRAAVEGKGESDLKLFMVTVLTSLDQSDMGATGYDMPLADLAVNRAQRAMRCGVDGVIASGLEARAIKNAAGRLGREFLVTSPGIRPKTTNSDDHKRVATPSAAITAGADYLVIGRPIIRAADPARVTAAILNEMQSAFDAKTR